MSSEKLPPWLSAGQPIPLHDVGVELARLGPRVFEQQLAPAYLVLRSTLIAHRGAILATMSTMTLDSAQGGDAMSEALVYPVRSTGRSMFPQLISIGRTKNNDIVIADSSVSKFHAFFSSDNGHFVLYDAGSRNGTFVDGSPVPRRGAGRGVIVPKEALIRCGNIELTYHDASGLAQLVQRVVLAARQA